LTDIGFWLGFTRRNFLGIGFDLGFFSDIGKSGLGFSGHRVIDIINQLLYQK